MQVLRRRHTVLQCYGTALFWLKPESNFSLFCLYTVLNKAFQAKHELVFNCVLLQQEPEQKGFYKSRSPLKKLGFKTIL